MYSILLVDDEPLVIKGIRIILEKSGLPIYHIQEAENGDEALSIIKEKSPDILITDIRMPMMDGLELCKRIFKKCPDTDIIIVSGYDDFKYAQEAIKYGVREYLLKPVQKADLIKVITEIIEERKNIIKPQYIAHNDLDEIIRKLENGLWQSSEAEIQQGLRKLRGLFEKVSLEYCIDIANDLKDTLLNRLSLKIGYTLKLQFTPYTEKDKESFYAWFEGIINNLLLELKERREKSDYNLFEMAREYIKENYASDITLEELARKTGFNPNYFSQLFKIKTGKTFVQFRSEIRIKKAMELLCRPDKTITEVALDVGYNDLTYFIRAFKDYTGVTPNEYKRKRG